MTIRPATQHDLSTVMMLFMKMLVELQQYGHDLLPTVDNSIYFANNLFSPAIQLRSPVLLSYGDEAIVTGALFWTIDKTPFEVKYRTSTGWGTYVVPEYRRQGIATALRQEGFRILRELGVQKLIGTVQCSNTASLAASEKMGMVNIGLVQECLL